MPTGLGPYAYWIGTIRLLDWDQNRKTCLLDWDYIPTLLELCRQIACFLLSLVVCYPFITMLELTSNVSHVYPMVVQHNALVNAQFNLTTTESRLFLAMLARISPKDTEFAKCQVEMHNILDVASNNYAHAKKVIDNFGSRKLRIEKLAPGGGRSQKRIFTVIPLVEYAEYREGGGYVEAQFNSRLLPYLLELRDNFTTAQLAELIKLKSPSSFRIYWILREYATFGKRTIPLDELKTLLGLENDYDRFNNFRVRVLDRTQKELADTDTAFTYETVKRGRDVVAIKFHLRHNGEYITQTGSTQPLQEWEDAVLATGVSLKSLPQIKERLDADDYDLGYVSFVLDTVKSQVQSGKIKKEGGAVFKALVEGYLLPAYRKAKQRQSAASTKAKPKNNPAIVNQLKKLKSELEDLNNSLNFTKTAVIYNDETRPAVMQQIQEHITRLEQRYHELNAKSSS